MLPGYGRKAYGLRGREILSTESPRDTLAVHPEMSFVDRRFPQISPAVRANVRIDLLAATLFGAFSGLTTPFIPVMGRRLGASPLEVSLLVASPAIVLLLSLWWANLIRLTHPVSVVVYPTLLGRALFLLMPFIDTPGVYVTLIVLYQGITSIGTLGYAQVMRSVYPEDVRGRIMAGVRVGMALVWIAASLVGGRVMQQIPFQWVFAVAALGGMASSIVFSRIQHPTTVEEVDRISLSSTWQVLRENRAFRRFLTGFFAFGFGAWLISPAIPILLVDVLHASNFQVGLLGAVTSGMWLLSYYYWGRMIDRRRAPGALTLVFLIGAVTPLVYFFATTPWVVLLAGVTDGMTSAGVDLGWLTAVLQYAPLGQVRHYVGIFNTLVGVRGSIAPFLTGFLIPRIGVRAIFALAVGFILLGVSIMRGAASRRFEANTG